MFAKLPMRGSIMSVYNSVTFEKEHDILHPEGVHGTCVGRAGSLLLTYGYRTTKIWNLSTGKCVKMAASPEGYIQPTSIVSSV